MQPYRSGQEIFIRQLGPGDTANTSILRCGHPVSRLWADMNGQGGRFKAAHDVLDLLARQLGDEMASLAMPLFCGEAMSTVEVNMPVPVKVEWVDDPMRMRGTFMATCTCRVFSPTVPRGEVWEYRRPTPCWAEQMADSIMGDMEEECTIP